MCVCTVLYMDCIFICICKYSYKIIIMCITYLGVLDEWGVPPMSEESQEIKQLHDLIKEKDLVNKQDLNKHLDRVENLIDLKKTALFDDVTTHQEQLISEVKKDIIMHQEQLISEVRNEIYHLLEEKETAHAKHR